MCFAMVSVHLVQEVFNCIEILKIVQLIYGIMVICYIVCVDLLSMYIYAHSILIGISSEDKEISSTGKGFELSHHTWPDCIGCC